MCPLQSWNLSSILLSNWSEFCLAQMLWQHTYNRFHILHWCKKGNLTSSIHSLTWLVSPRTIYNQECESASTSSTLRQMCSFVASNSERQRHFKSKIKCWISERYPFFLLDPLWSGPPVTVSKCRMLMTWSPENSQLFTASHFAHARQHWDHGSNTWPHILVIYDP